MLAKWPEYKKELHFPKQAAMLARVKDVVRAVRTVRKDMEVPNSRKAKLLIVSKDAQIRDQFVQAKSAYQNLAFANEVIIQPDDTGIPKDAVSAVIPDATVYIPLEELVDRAKELERLTKEKKKLEKELERSHHMLQNEKFLKKAPQSKIEEEKEKLAGYEKMMAEVEQRLVDCRGQISG